MKKLLGFWPLLLSSLHCAHSVHEVHVSDFAPQSKTRDGRTIYAHSEEKLMLGISAEPNLVDTALTDLLRKCPAGVISGITTAYITDLGFLSWTNHIYMTGQCLESPSAHYIYGQRNENLHGYGHDQTDEGHTPTRPNSSHKYLNFIQEIGLMSQ